MDECDDEETSWTDIIILFILYFQDGPAEIFQNF